MKTKHFIAFIILLSCFGCEDETFTPKPTGYFRIELPEKKYHQFDKDCPYTYEVPDYTNITPNINNPDKTCWYDINFNNLNAVIYISYKAVDNDLNQFLEDSRTLAFKHTIKAYDIEQQIINIPEKKVYGLIYNIEGNAASAYQFHLTDSTNHFVRGSLYFNNIPNQDSIQPVLSFIKKDIEHIIETFEWK